MSKERHEEGNVLHTVGLVDDAAVHLDVGCSTGTDLRKLADEGWTTSRLIGVDRDQVWIDLDYKQYEDRATCDIKFVAGDIFHDDLLQTLQRLAQRCSNVPAERTPPDPPQSNIRCISAFSFFHLFDEAGQKDLAIKLGVAFIADTGKHHSRVTSRTTHGRTSRPSRIGAIYCRSPTSWTSLWQDQVFSKSNGISVHVEAEIRAESDDREIDSVMVWSVTIA